MKIEIISTIEDFYNLKSIWQNIYSKSSNNHIHSTFEWLYNWWNSFGEDKNLVLLLFSNSEIVVGIIPLMSIKERFYNILPINKIKFIGSGISDYADIICIDSFKKDIIKQFIGYLQKKQLRFDIIELNQLNSRSSTFGLLKNELEKNDISYDIPIEIDNIFIPIEGSFGDYFNTLSKKFKKSITRSKNRLYELKGQLFQNKYENYNQNIFNKIIDLNKKRNAVEKKPSFLLTKAGELFVQNIWSNTNFGNNIVVFTLEDRENILAYRLCLKDSSTLYCWNTSYDINLRRYSPSLLVQHQSVEYAFDNNFMMIDLMRGSSVNKLKWSDKVYKNYGLRIYNTTTVYGKSIDILRNLKQKI